MEIRFGASLSQNSSFRRTMEDTYVVKADLAVDYPSVGSKNFLVGVFDGHGGAKTALHTAEVLPEVLADQLRALASLNSGSQEDSSASDSEPSDSEAATAPETGSPSEQADAGASVNASPEARPMATNSGAGSTPQFTAAHAIDRAFARIDEQLANDNVRLPGSAVAVCLLTEDPTAGRRILTVGNLGDVKAVLIPGPLDIFRSPPAELASRPVYDLSLDHTPRDTDERDRVLRDGGLVFRNRVGGVLAVSRALGDLSLKPAVSVRPFTVEFDLEQVLRAEGATEGLLVVASDGLWNVFKSDDLAAEALSFFERKAGRGGTGPAGSPDPMATAATATDEDLDSADLADGEDSLCHQLADHLVKTSITSGSMDNITAVVVRVTLPPVTSA
ncbi:hypothetical protein H696_00469 [Fonticula alba]|uniref:PPM-type phosphatase domain-containing protein n=1 Tax=Fonticula alba TaxID=691883 RepID=A0A058ZEU6_FONAL|nr:hypothetical protein H696_00469 [Fonticula alba]KCV72899.1 hypothetical protein H696_00469 [Fonticula alba]|eukprot:XP_009492600.1 hypothetical protein H696_00469 [Fonticula alba]